MHGLRITTLIAAPPAVCFDLARDVDAHLRSAGPTGEKVVGGMRAGLLGLGDEVTWEGRHFGVTQRFSSRITAFDRPGYFQDRMTHGAFRFFEHDHFFDPADNAATRMIDVVRFAAPLGPFGWIAERVLLKRHLTKFLTLRAEVLRRMAETVSRSS